MPDSFGKRQRDQVKARKAAARDDRRIARNKRRKGIAPAEQHGVEFGLATPPDRNGEFPGSEETSEPERPASDSPG
jgi:hypothetical protein